MGQIPHHLKTHTRTMSDHPPAPPAPDDELLAQADALHDDAPQRALELLRCVRVQALSLGRLPRLAFLLNHVFGEKFDLWGEAFAGQAAIVARLGADVTPVVLRQAAVAAQVAGDTPQARAWTESLAASADSPLAKARALVTLGAVGFSVSRQSAENAGRLTLQALAPLAALHALPGTGLDAAFGAVTNNLATELLERPLDDLTQPFLRTALELTVEHAYRFWRRAGTWLNHERAHYLCAMSANALGHAALATAQAHAGLALLDAHDAAHQEDVDRAFLELELALGLRLQAQAGQAEALARADALAARFGDASLDTWFAGRRARNEALAGHYAN
jgi:hypothetical protein